MGAPIEASVNRHGIRLLHADRGAELGYLLISFDNHSFYVTQSGAIMSQQPTADEQTLNNLWHEHLRAEFDAKFYDWLPRLFPHMDARAWFIDKPAFAEATAFRNSSLQGAYFIIAARSLGLDCGPMSGFDNEAVDKEFFPGGQVKSNFLCAIGYGDPAGVFERLPRPTFGEVCSIV
jgi:hypothetical protein